MRTRNRIIPLAVIAAACSPTLATTYTVKDIGLTGSAFVGTDPVFGTGVEQSTINYANSQGIALGSTAQYTPGTNSSPGSEMWYFNGSTTVPIGLLTSQYVNGGNGFVNEGVGSLAFSNTRIFNNGYVTGYSVRYDTDTNHTSLGYDSWIYNSAITTPGYTGTQIPLPTSIPLPGVTGVTTANLSYSFTAPTGGTKEAFGGPSNSAMTGGNGSAAGTMTDYYYTGTTWQSTGTDAWYFDGTSTKTIGLTTGNDVATSSNSTGAVGTNNVFTRSSTLTRVNATGQVLGYSTYWNGATNSFPSPIDLWLYDPNNATGAGTNGTQVLAPPSSVTGESYQGDAIGSIPTYLNDSGQVAAQFTLIANTATNRAQPLSADAWLSTSGNTGWVQLGLTSGTSIYNFIPAATTGSGTGGSNFGGTGFLANYPALNNLGQAAGLTKRTAGTSAAPVSLGQDAWVYYPAGHVPSGATVGITQVGLLGGAYETNTGTGVNRTSNAVALSNSGAVAGTSSRFQTSTATSSAGQDAWYYDPANGITSSTVIGLTGTVNGKNYEDTPTGATNNFRFSSITAMNQTGMVGGISIRLPQANSTSSNPSSATNGGQDAWVYSAATGKTYDVDPNSTASQAKWYSTITYISDTGVALGYDDPTYTTSTPLTSTKLFEWYLGYDSADSSYDLPTFQYLNTLIDPASFTNWAGLYQTIGYAPSLSASGTIIGYGGLTSDNSSSYVPVVLTPESVPEPASLGVIASGTVLLLGRRRRKA